MVFYKGTKKKIQNYISMIDGSQNYQGVTNTWAEPMEVSGDWYVIKHPGYPATDGLIEAEPPEPEGIDEI